MYKGIPVYIPSSPVPGQPVERRVPACGDLQATFYIADSLTRWHGFRPQALGAGSSAISYARPCLCPAAARARRLTEQVSAEQHLLVCARGSSAEGISTAMGHLPWPLGPAVMSGVTFGSSFCHVCSAPPHPQPRFLSIWPQAGVTAFRQLRRSVGFDSSWVLGFGPSRASLLLLVTPMSQPCHTSHRCDARI